MWQGGGVLFLIAKVSQYLVYDVLVFVSPLNDEEPVFKSKRSPAHHFHLGVESFGGAIALVTAPHHDDGLKP